MISIVMSYYNRRQLLFNTLHSIKESKCKSFEVVIVDDASDDKIDDIVRLFDFPINIIRIDPKNKYWHNPCVAYNIGFKHAQGDIVLIQNPEVLHRGDLLSHISQHIRKGDYMIFSCYAMTKEQTADSQNRGPLQYIDSISLKSNKAIPQRGIDGWYCHPKHRPRPYHFVSAMHTSDLLDMNGFNEEFAQGNCFDDDDFALRASNILNVYYVTNPIGVHQWHPSLVNQRLRSKNLSIIRNLYGNYRKRLESIGL